MSSSRSPEKSTILFQVTREKLKPPGPRSVQKIFVCIHPVRSNDLQLVEHLSDLVLLVVGRRRTLGDGVAHHEINKAAVEVTDVLGPDGPEVDDRPLVGPSEPGPADESGR